MVNSTKIAHNNLIVIISLIGLLTLPLLIRYLLRYLVFREKLHRLKVRNPVVTQYDAPINIPPAFFGTMLVNRLRLNQISSTILNLHVKGYLKIEYNTQINSFQIRLVSNQPQNLFRHEQYVLTILEPHFLNGVMEASLVGKVSIIAQPAFMFVLEQDLQIAGYYMFDSNMNNLTPTSFFMTSTYKSMLKAIFKPWNWPGYILSLFLPEFAIFWIIIAILFYNRIGIYKYKTKKWEEVWPDIEGYYNYLFEVEKQPRDYDLEISPELFKISVHDPYLLASEIENKWNRIFGLVKEISSGSNKDYKVM